MNTQQLENELWDSADQLRANSKLTAAEYSMPLLGLIFLRHADSRFKGAYLPGIEADIPSQVPAAQREEPIKLGFQGKAASHHSNPRKRILDWQLDVTRKKLTQALLEKARDVDEWTLYYALSEPSEALSGKAPLEVVSPGNMGRVLDVLLDQLDLHD